MQDQLAHDLKKFQKDHNSKKFKATSSIESRVREFETLLQDNAAQCRTQGTKKEYCCYAAGFIICSYVILSIAALVLMTANIMHYSHKGWKWYSSSALWGNVAVPVAVKVAVPVLLLVVLTISIATPMAMGAGKHDTPV